MGHILNTTYASYNDATKVMVPNILNQFPYHSAYAINQLLGFPVLTTPFDALRTHGGDGRQHVQNFFRQMHERFTQPLPFSC